jgi:hypothetical protein
MIVPADAEKIVTDTVKAAIDASLLPTPPAGAAWRRGTTVTPGTTPQWFIQVRMVGGTEEQRVAHRPLVDIRVWADGTSATEATRSLAARTLMGRLRDVLNCRVFAMPVPLPDPADTTKVHTLFTVQLLTKGVQQ